MLAKRNELAACRWTLKCRVRFLGNIGRACIETEKGLTDGGGDKAKKYLVCVELTLGDIGIVRSDTGRSIDGWMEVQGQVREEVHDLFI